MKSLSSSKGRLATIASLAAVALMLGGALAYACTNLATLNLEKATGAAGDQLAVTGSSFGAEQPVTLHWNSLEGAELATVKPDQAGNISATVTIPEAQPGYYVLVATQTDEEGNQVFGGPARATFQVLGPAGAALDAQPASGEQLAAFSEQSQGISTGMIALTALLGIAGIGLFGAGVAGFVRQTRGAETPARVRSDS